MWIFFNPYPIKAHCAGFSDGQIEREIETGFENRESYRGRIESKISFVFF